MITKLKTIPQVVAEITAEERNLLAIIDILYSFLHTGQLHVYIVNDTPLLDIDEVSLLIAEKFIGRSSSNS